MSPVPTVAFRASTVFLTQLQIIFSYFTFHVCVPVKITQSSISHTSHSRLCLTAFSLSGIPTLPPLQYSQILLRIHSFIWMQSPNASALSSQDCLLTLSAAVNFVPWEFDVEPGVMALNWMHQRTIQEGCWALSEWYCCLPLRCFSLPDSRVATEKAVMSFWGTLGLSGQKKILGAPCRNVKVEEWVPREL